MRVVITGATGNVGTSVISSLTDEPSVDSIVALSRRLPRLRIPGVEWRSVDVSSSELEPHFADADVVIHLAWLIQPGRDEQRLRATNVNGSRRVFEAVRAARVPALLYASSVGAYSPGPKDRRVGEDWPTHGITSSFYSRHKAEVERLLDTFERDTPGVRVVRMRPGLIFKRDAASGIRRLFAGPFLPSRLLRPSLIPVLPLPRELRFQAVHSHCVGEAFRRAAIDAGAHGAFNLAADPVLDPEEIGRLLSARPFAIPAGVLRAGAGAAFKARLQPSEPGWLDMALEVPLMSSDRAKTLLGWTPRRDARDALLELIDGIRDSAGIETPPLSPHTSGRLRTRELAGGLGAREMA